MLHAIALTIVMQQHASMLFKNGRPVGVLKFPAGVKMGVDALKRI